MSRLRQIFRGPRGGRWRLSAAGSLLRAAGLGALLLCGGLARAGEPGISKEYQVKAAFLYNFTKFVEWPPASFADSTSPIVIGVLGENPFGSELARLVKDRKVNGREILVRTFATPGDVAGVHVMFVGALRGRAAEELKQALRATAVLSVGESPEFAASGGIIRFVVEGDKVGFAINQEASDRAGLKLSSQLLKLATAVRKKS